MQKKRSIKTIFIIKRQLKILKRNTVIAGETPCTQLTKTTGSNTWAAETLCTRSVLHTPTNTSTAAESYCKRKTARCGRGSRKFRSLQLRLLSSFWFKYCVLIFSILMLILLHYFEYSSTIFIYFACFLNSQDIFKAQRLSQHSGIVPWQKVASLPACPGETP
jgi:hypothetical protein